MIEEQAQVIAIENDDTIVVESVVKSSCSSCQQLESCGSGQISKAFPQKRLTYRLPACGQVNVGDQVIIGLSEKLLLSSAWQVYMWPLIGLIAASVFGQWLVDIQVIQHELIALALGILGGYLGFYLARKKQLQSASNSQWTPSLIKIVGSSISISQIHR